MKSSRTWIVWTALAVCAVLVIGAMAWFTREILASEKDRANAEARADLEERTRLALWRMDAMGSAIILRENSLRPNEYGKSSKLSDEAKTPELLLHFEVSHNKALTSPEEWKSHFPPRQDVGVKQRDTNSKGITTIRRSQVSLESIVMEGHLKRLRALLNANPLPDDEWGLLKDAMDAGEAAWQAIPKDAAREQNENLIQREQKSGTALRKDVSYQNNSYDSERAQRAKALEQAVDNSTQVAEKHEMPIAAGTRNLASEIGRMRAVWISGDLFLLRKIKWNVYHFKADGNELLKPAGQEVSIQGAWMKLPELRSLLLREVADLLPHANLVPVEGERAAADPLALVSFPFILQRGESLVLPPAHWSAPLIVGWVAALGALGMAALLVFGVMRLSERRASFVSAVTHELRTPLTTFRLYADMLESGAVKEEKRGHYLRVLSREADRLSHLVENVLAFSRIERGNARSNVREMAADEMMERMHERLESRLATAGLTLEMECPPTLRVRVDTAAVEHILFNLIDNAAKYAATSEPPFVKILTQAVGRGVEIIVTDHGPGIPASERGRIFQAFHKSAREAAESQPGVGLGLALSRRLARAMRGDLKCGNSETGASFILSLPAA